MHLKQGKPATPNTYSNFETEGLKSILCLHSSPSDWSILDLLAIKNWEVIVDQLFT